MLDNAERAMIYGDFAPNDYPMYSARDASRCIKVPYATLRAWFVGTNRGAFQPVLTPRAVAPLKLSFNDLAEAFVVHNLRTEHEVKLSKIREAIAEAERELGIERLLLRSDLKTFAGDLLIEKFGEYMTFGLSRQYAMKKLLDAVLDRFVWEDPNFPAMLFPYLPGPPVFPDRIIAINPKRSFGAPYLESRGVTTSVIVMRFNSGESITEISKDYNIEEREVSAAIVYEEAA